MTFRQLALSNIRGSLHRYAAFFLSSSFSVLLFFIYAQFIFHPDVVNGHIEAAGEVRQGLVACEYIIIVFSFFFVLYSNTAFLKSRNKEFGLLSLFGVTRKQLARMIWYENAVIALAAIAVGIAFGSLFSKLFFMALAQLLEVQNPIRFLVVPKAVLVTGVGFFVLFQLITLVSLWKIGRQEIVELLKESRKPKKPPVASVWLTLLAVVTIGAGYYLAYTTTLMTLMVRFLPVIGLVVLGTYFLFSQVSVFVLGRLQKSQSYFSGTRMLVISQLVFKMKDNARLLFSVAVLSAVVLTASGTFYVYMQGNKEQMLMQFPQAAGYIEEGGKGQPVVDPEKVKQALEQHGASDVSIVSAHGVLIPFRVEHFNMPKDSTIMALPESQYLHIRETLGMPKEGKLEKGHALFIFPYPQIKVFEGGVTYSYEFAGVKHSFVIDKQLNEPLLNAYKDSGPWFVLDDDDFAALNQAAPEETKLHAYGFEWSNWEDTLPAVEQARQLLPKGTYMTSRTEQYINTKQLSSLTMFIGIFISILFFIAAGSMIYFRLLTELQDEQQLYRSLRRIGLSSRELKRIVTAQIALIFFVPFLVGTGHAAFAMKALSNLLGQNIGGLALLVMAIFFAMQTLFFLITRGVYSKQLQTVR
ncbi:FtsX-like permease family protein [Paenibacillus turpanensis]|uniref:FtsX-like permease family protein n=1 Tax=Paenibacillus turpanensis TaxID=2689078 RepID=UPI00140BC690|nr:ABC transporter permease [Paenibacillus turpanensis]